MKKVRITKENIKAYSLLFTTKIEEGDIICINSTSCETKLELIPMDKESEITPEMMLELDSEYGETLKNLVER